MSEVLTAPQLRDTAAELLNDANRLEQSAADLGTALRHVADAWGGPGQRRMEEELSTERRELYEAAREIRAAADRAVARAEELEAAVVLDA